MSAATSDQKTNPIYIVIQQKQSSKRSMSNTYKTSAAKVLGVIHLLCGVVALGTGIGIIFIPYSGFVYMDTGIWTSVFFFVTGGLSISSAISANSCLVIGTLVMSIFSAICGGILLITSSISLGIESYYFKNQLPAVCQRQTLSQGTMWCTPAQDPGTSASWTRFQG